MSEMSNADQRPEQLAFVDLKAQQARIRERIDSAIARVLDHGQYIMGPEVAELEQRLAGFTGARHVISCASGTDALLIAMMALGLERGDAVVCPAFTFTATPEAAALLGATPVFVDVDEATFNIAVSGLESGLEAARLRGLNPVGLIAADLFGLPADYQAIEEFAGRHGLWVIADAAQSFGAQLGTRKVGTFGTITTTSFFPAKPLGCYGDGGALMTGDEGLAAAARSIRLHGKAYGGGKYDIERIGINGRLDTLQAAILLEKLTIFEEELALRQAVARRYHDGLADCIAVPRVPDGSVSSWAQYTIRVPPKQRSLLRAALKSDGIPTAIYYPRPLHHQPAYNRFPVAAQGVPVAERLTGEALSLPMHPYLTATDQRDIIDRVRCAIQRS